MATCLVALPLIANAGGSASNGKKLVGLDGKGCAACHGEDGNSTIPTFPILAGQYEDYLVQAMEQYRSGARNNQNMRAPAQSLSDQEIADIAAWFSSQKSKLQYVK